MVLGHMWTSEDSTLKIYCCTLSNHLFFPIVHFLMHRMENNNALFIILMKELNKKMPVENCIKENVISEGR